MAQVLGRHYSERTAFGRTSLDLATKQGPMLLLYEFTNYDPAHMRRHLWLYTQHVLIPRPDPYIGEGIPLTTAQRPVLMAYIGSNISPFRNNLIHSMLHFQRNSEGEFKMHVDGFCRETRLQ
eukprot:gene26474-32481_t